LGDLTLGPGENSSGMKKTPEKDDEVPSPWRKKCSVNENGICQNFIGSGLAA
jgi:hypothetical protein